MKEASTTQILDILRYIVTRKKLIFIYVLSFFIFGLIVALLMPRNYSSSLVFLPNNQNYSSGSGLSSLSNLAGINLSSQSSNSFPPQLFETILGSESFQYKLLDNNLKIRNDSSSFRYYYKNLHKEGVLNDAISFVVGIPSLIFSQFRSNYESINTEDIPDVFLRISKEDEAVIDIIKNNISIYQSIGNGTFTVSYTMQDPYLSSQALKLMYDELVELATEYRLSKLTNKVKNLTKLLDGRRDLLEKSQHKLNAFQDKNLQLNTASSKSKLNNLQSEYQLAFQIYSQVAQQLEQAKIELENETPVFTVIQPIKIPSKPTKSKFGVLIKTMLLGLSLSIIHIFVLLAYKRIL